MISARVAPALHLAADMVHDIIAIAPDALAAVSGAENLVSRFTDGWYYGGVEARVHNLHTNPSDVLHRNPNVPDWTRGQIFRRRVWSGFDTMLHPHTGRAKDAREMRREYQR